MGGRGKLGNLFLAPPAIRPRFLFWLIIAWVAVTIVAAAVLYMLVDGGGPLSPWQRAVVLFFFWPSCIGGPCLETPYFGALVLPWLTFLAWALTRAAAWLWSRDA